MHDLNATLFYKAKFKVTANAPSVDLLWTLVWEIRDWLLRKWNKDGHKIVKSNMRVWSRFKVGGKLYDEESTNHIYGESAFHSDNDSGVVSWACKIVEKKDPAEGFAQREWTTEIGYQSEDDASATISYVVTYTDMPGYIGFCEKTPTISLPRVVRNLLSHEKLRCSLGPDTLSAQPHWLNPGDYPAFEKVLFNPYREVPVIYISPAQPDEEGKDPLLLVDPYQMAKSVAGNAVVYCSNSLSFASEMRWFIDERYGCAGGAIRVYRPKIDPSDFNDRYKHRYISASFIQEQGTELVLDIFRRAFAQDVHFYDTMFRLENCKELQDAEARNQRIAALMEKSETDVDEAMREYIRESDKRKNAERDARAYKEELDRVKSDNYNLQIQVAALREKADRAREIEAASRSVRQFAEYPSTPRDVAKYFETVFPDRIVFTERAYRSMNDCITKCDLLWEVFYYMAVELFDLLHERPAQAYKEFTAKTGWDCARGVGMMTRDDKNLMKQYVDIFDGQEISIEAHIKSGNRDSDPKSVRIYFAYEPQITDRIIVGHCGKHIDNYSTRKAK